MKDFWARDFCSIFFLIDFLPHKAVVAFDDRKEKQKNQSPDRTMQKHSQKQKYTANLLLLYHRRPGSPFVQTFLTFHWPAATVVLSCTWMPPFVQYLFYSLLSFFFLFLSIIHKYSSFNAQANPELGPAMVDEALYARCKKDKRYLLVCLAGNLEMYFVLQVLFLQIEPSINRQPQRL